MVEKHRILDGRDLSEFSKIPCNFLIHCVALGMEQISDFNWVPITPSVPLLRLILSFLLYKNFGIIKFSLDFEII